MVAYYPKYGHPQCQGLSAIIQNTVTQHPNHDHPPSHLWSPIIQNMVPTIPRLVIHHPKDDYAALKIQLPSATWSPTIPSMVTRHPIYVHPWSLGWSPTILRVIAQLQTYICLLQHGYPPSQAWSPIGAPILPHLDFTPPPTLPHLLQYPALFYPTLLYTTLFGQRVCLRPGTVTMCHHMCGSTSNRVT